ncbi:hypothetical protein FRB96_003411 [Tulasnella sp. 330]|nr:hypothetical protein FRB96_003411 [Tulasnella sp. 330]
MVPITTTTANPPPSSAMASVMTSLSTSVPTMTPFKPPQHKHAHHLHSIPPREKNTRTLILDHMLYLHSKARFGQVNAELSPDGEKVSKDVPTAKALRARADGLEKMLVAMLVQPPEEVEGAWDDAEDVLSRDTALTSASSPTSPTTPPPTVLPNGIRLRIALARLINDLYAAQDSVDTASIAAGTITITDATASTSDPYPPAIPAYTSLSPALSALSRISSFAQHHHHLHKEHQLPKLPSFQTFTATASGSEAPPAHSLLPPPPAGSIFSTIPRGAGPESPWALGTGRGAYGSGTGSGSTFPPASLFGNGSGSSSGGGMLMPPPAPPRVFRAVGRSKDLYNAGVTTLTVTIPTRQQGSSTTAGNDGNATSTPQAHGRCPHHLTFTCQPSSFCSHVAPPPSANGGSDPAAYKRARSNIGSGLSRAGPPLRKAKTKGGNGAAASMTELIPRFLRLSASVAMELGREARDAAKDGKEATRDRDESDDEGGSSPSAMKGKGKGTRKSASSSNIASAALPTSQWYALLVSLLTRATLQGYLQKGWKGSDPVEILLGVGVGLKAPPPPSSDDEDEVELEDTEKQFLPDAWPATLTDAWAVLFGSGFNAQKKPMDDKYRGFGQDNSSPSGAQKKRAAYAEYERIMADRITDFLTLPHHDLATYLDFFSRNKYTQDSADKEALKFFEAVARWRGEPELESVKRQANSTSPSGSISISVPSQPAATTTASPTSPCDASSSSSLSSSSSSPTTPTQPPSIFQYFAIPPPSSHVTEHRRSTSTSSATSTSNTGSQKRKAACPDEDTESGAHASTKKAAVSSSSSSLLVPAWGHGRAWMEEGEWVGPYGL